MLTATCHCGAVRVDVPRKPRRLTSCNCSICRRYGTLWAYYKVSRGQGHRRTRRDPRLCLGRQIAQVRALRHVRLHHSLGAREATKAAGWASTRATSSPTRSPRSGSAGSTVRRHGSSSTDCPANRVDHRQVPLRQHRLRARMGRRPARDSGARLRLLVLRQARRRLDIQSESAGWRSRFATPRSCRNTRSAPARPRFTSARAAASCRW